MIYISNIYLPNTHKSLSNASSISNAHSAKHGLSYSFSTSEYASSLQQIVLISLVHAHSSLELLSPSHSPLSQTDSTFNKPSHFAKHGFA